MDLDSLRVCLVSLAPLIIDASLAMLVSSPSRRVVHVHNASVKMRILTTSRGVGWNSQIPPLLPQNSEGVRGECESWW